MSDSPVNASGNSVMPVLFIGHGNPMNAIEDNPFATAWQDETEWLPKPKAILCISAHWETDGARVSAVAQPKTIHDFYGFPEELYQVDYPAPGSPQLAQRVRELAGTNLVDVDQDRGLDHGTWAVLRRMYPAADIQTLQLSLDRRRPPKSHLDLARKLQPLREEGVLILGSGNMVHNLPLMRWKDRRPYPWAEEFDALAVELILAGEVDKLADYSALGEAARLSIPTNEHYLPLLYVLALRNEHEPVSFFAEGIVLGSVSMRSLRIG